MRATLKEEESQGKRTSDGGNSCSIDQRKTDEVKVNDRGTINERQPAEELMRNRVQTDGSKERKNKKERERQSKIQK